MQNFRTAFIALFLCFSASQFIAQNQEWLIASSSVKFKIKNAGFNVDGSFSGLGAKIIFDVAKTTGNSIDAIVSSKTINTGVASRDEHLKKPEYFNVNQYALVSMKATEFTKEKDGSYKGTFKLTIKDKTKEIVVPFTFTELNGKATLKTVFIINRLDFNVGESSMVLSNNVTITIEVNAIKK